MRDFYHNLLVKPALAPAVVAASGNGLTVDVTDATGVVFVVETGAIVSAGDFSVKLQEGMTGSDWADVPAAKVKSDAPATLAASSVYRLGYAGYMKLARLVVTKAGGTSIALGATAVCRPKVRPVE